MAETTSELIEKESELELFPPAHADPIRRGLGARTLSRMTTGGLRQSTLTLISTAVGGGVLSMSYMEFLTGLGLGTLLLLIGALLAFTSTVALMDMQQATGLQSYSAIFSHCAGSWAGPLLDALLFLFGNGACVGYFVLLSDFVTALLARADVPHWMASRSFPILVGAAVVVFPSTLREASLMSKVAPLSIMALAYVTTVVAVQAPSKFKPIPDRPDQHNMPWFNFSWHLPEAFAMCVFAYNCHLNVVPVASVLVSPTPPRIRKVAARANTLQLTFYLIVAIAGHLSFVTDTPQDILSGYDSTDPWIAAGRALLSVTMLVAIPLNMIPTVQSGLLLLGAARGIPVSHEASFLARAVMALSCICCQVFLAITVEGVAVVISLLGGTIATAMILIIPGYCIGVVLPRTRANRMKQVMLWMFSVLSFSSVPITVMKLAGVWNPPIHTWDKQ